MLFVLDGFYAALFSYSALTFFIRAALNISTGILDCYPDGPSVQILSIECLA